MFFIFGINSGTKRLSYARTVICPLCGRYGRYEVFMTYMCFSLFFLPILRWNRRFYVKMSCCGSVYELEPEKGRRILKGAEEEIGEADLTLAQRGGGSPDSGGSPGFVKRCSSCGYETEEDFAYCPKCGRPI